MSSLHIVEVGPRDGLQNEPGTIEIDTKIELIRRLAQAGLRTIEAGSFVSPRWVPQMADTAQVLAGLDLTGAIGYPVLVPNAQGLDRALEAGVREIAVFTAASETFSIKNTNASIEECFARLAPVMTRALAAGLSVRGYVSCVLGCPYEGEVSPDRVADVAARLSALGAREISLGDTIGVGTPGKARALIERVGRDVPVSRLALHFHDTYGQALANIEACLSLGVQVFDSSVAGLGGCPYARGATGNVATEDLVYMLHGMGFDTGIDFLALCRVGAWISNSLNRQNQSRAGRAALAREEGP